MKKEQGQQVVSTTLGKLNALSETSCKELTDTTKRQKITECDNFIQERLARAKEQPKQPTIAEGKSTEPTAKERGIWSYEAFPI